MTSALKLTLDEGTFSRRSVPAADVVRRKRCHFVATVVPA
jgi:hypothetical protein